MASTQLRLGVRNVDGLKARIKAKTERKKARVLAVSKSEALIVFDLAQALANRDTSYMANQMRLEFTRGDYNWTIFFRAEDFIGRVNTLARPPRLILSFYPAFVIKGTRYRAGNNFLAEALRLRRQQIREGYRKAVAG